MASARLEHIAQLGIKFIAASSISDATLIEAFERSQKALRRALRNNDLDAIDFWRAAYGRWYIVLNHRTLH